jgi:hypothetical protein
MLNTHPDYKPKGLPNYVSPTGCMWTAGGALNKPGRVQI